MAQEQSPDPSELSGRLHEIAGLLRGTHHLGPEAQQALARLADEMANLLDPEKATAEAESLVASTAKVVEALREGQGGPLNAARQRLHETVAEVEARAPGSADFARNLLEVLANLGI